MGRQNPIENRLAPTFPAVVINAPTLLDPLKRGNRIAS
jgi:hypothetical protein